MEANWSLADHRGGFGYGNMKAKISLLPEALFLKYKALLALDDWWWLVAPYAGVASYARIVYTDGSLYGNYAYIGGRGVRPAFFAESGIILELPEHQLETVSSSYTSSNSSSFAIEILPSAETVSRRGT